MSNKQIASLLDTTMTNAGYIDDYAEILHGALDDGIDVKAVHEETIAGIKFINEYLNHDYDVELWNRDYREMTE